MGRLAVAACAVMLLAEAVVAVRDANPAPAPATVTVTMSERRCALSQATVPRGVLVFRLVNRGLRASVFTIARARSAFVRPRTTSMLRVTLSTPGTYRYACTPRGARGRRIGGVLRVTGAVASSSSPCGTASRPPGRYEHVVWIVMENRDYGQVIGSPDAPYINELAHECGLATDFHAETHPSLPNYIALTSGDTQGIADDGPPAAHPLDVPSIFSQLGTGWRALQESMPGNCRLSSSGLYAVRHNPAAYYVPIRTACIRQDVPLEDPPDVSARFTFITPDRCSDMHDCSTGVGDRWLARWLPKIFDSPEYASGTTAVFLTWDEDDHRRENHIATLVMSPSTRRATTASERFDHYSLLRTTEELLGIRTYLGQARSAPSMRAAFHL